MSETTVDFQKDVVDASAEKPVVVDLWAEWCGPCRALGPHLERECSDAGVELVKIDIDAQPDVAAELGVMSIPAVKAFRGGRVVDEFVGAIPPPMVKEWVRGVSGADS